MIASFDLPPTIIPHNLDVLRKLSETERDLIRVIVEVVHEIRDAGVDPDETANDEDTRVAPDFEEEEEEGLEFGAAPPIAAEKPLHRALARMSLAKGEAVEGEAAEVQRKAIVDNRALMVLKALLERVNGVSSVSSLFDASLHRSLTLVFFSCFSFCRVSKRTQFLTVSFLILSSPLFEAKSPSFESRPSSALV